MIKSDELNTFLGSCILFSSLLSDITVYETLNIIFIFIISYICTISINCEYKYFKKEMNARNEQTIYL